MKRGKRIRLKAKAEVPRTFSLPASVAVVDQFLRLHKGKPQRKIHSSLFLIHASHDSPHLLPVGGIDEWYRLDQCIL